MLKPTKEQLAEALGVYPTWGHAYVAEKARAEAAEARIVEQGEIIKEHAVTIAVQYRNLRAAEARIAEVERKATRYEAAMNAQLKLREAAEADLLLAAQQNTQLSERLDRLEGALRTIAEHTNNCACGSAIHPSQIARAALAEEPYADVPGAS